MARLGAVAATALVCLVAISRARVVQARSSCVRQQQVAFVGTLLPSSSPTNESVAPLLLRRNTHEADRTGSDDVPQEDDEGKAVTGTSDPSDANQQARALHELKERAKAVGQLEAIKTGAGKFAKLTERMAKGGGGGGGGRILGNAGKRTGKRTIQKAGKLAGGKVMAISRAGEKAVKETTKRFGGKAAGKRAAGRANAAVVAPALRGASTQIAASKQVGAASYSRARAAAAARATMKHSPPPKAAGNILQRTMRSRIPKLKKKGAVVLLNAKRKGTAAVVARRAKSSTTRRALSASTRRVALRRFGRGLLIALPALGGIFALLTLQADCARAHEELERRRTGDADRTDWSVLAFALFAAAACADYVDALCHVLISRAALIHHLHGRAYDVMATESVSMACAVVSTVGAVVGELASQRRVDGLLCDDERSLQHQQLRKNVPLATS